MNYPGINFGQEPSLFSSATLYAREIKEQCDLLDNCVAKGGSLATALAALGKTYDDLMYLDNPPRPSPGSRYYTIEDFSQACNKIPLISFFSGAGGLDIGLEAAGFSHRLLIEKSPLFCNTIKQNRPDWNVANCDITNTEEVIEVISQLIGSNSSYDGVFVGGPPCQPFSIAANQRFRKNGANFKRVGFAHVQNGNLLFDYIQIIRHFLPRAFLIENVPGLIDIDGGEQLENAYRLLEKSGYLVHQPLILKADAYYVPQQRIRLFIIGNRIAREFVPPKPTHLPSPVAHVFNLKTTGVDNHVTREHSAQSILRYMRLRFGERDKLGRVDRLDPNLPSKTVIAGGTAGGGRSHLHPYIPRTLSVRECARIQTFPDNYIFTGPVARQFTQVGNAVPPVLGAQLGTALYKSFFE